MVKSIPIHSPAVIYYGIALKVLIGCLGNIGNFISILILSTTEMRNPFNSLLIFLAVRNNIESPDFSNRIALLEFNCFLPKCMMLQKVHPK